MITSEAVFDHSALNNLPTQQTHGNPVEVPVIGDASETALVRFFQPIEDILVTRAKRRVHLLLLIVDRHPG
jgi:sodium/potassium-transporting ATPase subunit alpha